MTTVWVTDSRILDAMMILLARLQSPRRTSPSLIGCRSGSAEKRISE